MHLSSIFIETKGGEMKSKLLLCLISVILIGPLVSAQPQVKFGGLFYVYSFMWQNADFNGDTEDGDQHFYVHGDVWGQADFGKGVSAKVSVGDWGTFGRDPITYAGQEGVGGHLLEAYLTANNLFETPLGLRVGKEHVLYGDGMVAFDGGEDGIMGVKLFYNTPMFNFDLFDYRLQEGGGTGSIGTGVPAEDDHDLLGCYATLKLMEGNVGVSPYVFYRTHSWKYEPSKDDTVYSDNPMWFGLRSEGTPVKGLSYKGEFTMMGGKCEDIYDTTNYKGMAYMAELNYSLEETGIPLTLGGAYVAFSGDDTSTTEDNELYESATNGPYTFGFYKAWPGFGPAHLLLTGYGFSCLAPWEPMVRNLNVINGHLQYTMDPITARLDFFNYTRNQAEWGNPETDIGNEIGVHLTYNYEDALTFGFAGGYFMPGKYFGEDLDAMLGGYIYLAKGF